MRWLCILFALSSCSSYSRGTLEEQSPLARVAHLECLDVVLDVGHEICPYTDGRCPKDPVAAFAIGNHCDRAVSIDFSRVRFYATPSGTELRLHNPNGVTLAGVLDARSTARERFELRQPPQGLHSICADLSGFSENATRRDHLCVPLARLGVNR